MNNYNDNKELTSTNLISIFVGFVLTVALIVLDQLTKAMAVTNLMNKPSYVLIDGVFELMYLENRGAAFGVLQNQKWFFVVGAVAVVIIAGYIYYKVPNTKKYFITKVICILMTAGAVGNMIDRFLNNYVIDFFYFSLINFPVFNVADIYVTVGAAMMFIAILFIYKDGDFGFLFPNKKEGKEKGDINDKA